MQTRKGREQEELFVAGPLSSLIPADHLFRQVDGVLDLSWLHEEVRDCYHQEMGRPSIDPESALRLMLAGFFEGIVHDRKLLRRAQTDLAFRWFAGYRLDEKLPHHSSLTRIRQRWGVERFKRVFQKTVQACLDAGLVNAETIHVDATLIRADVSWESLTTRHADDVFEANRAPDRDEQTDPDEPRGKGLGKSDSTASNSKKQSTTDPDASMATSNKRRRLEPTFKQHTAVEDQSGVVVDVAVTTGEENEGKHLVEQLERVEETTGTKPRTVTADAGYAHAANYAALEERSIDAVIPPQRASRRKKERLPLRRFKYDAQHDWLTCPGGCRLSRKGRSQDGRGYWYRARGRDCACCPLKSRCISDKAHSRSILLADGYPALLRARRRKEKGWDAPTRDAYTRHRWRVEGVHGRVKTHHGLHRAARRGLDNVTIQALLSASVMNLKRLAAACFSKVLLWDCIEGLWKRHKHLWRIGNLGLLQSAPTAA